MIKEVAMLSTALLLLDAVYLNLVGKFYGKMIRSIQGSEMEVRWSSAIVTYIFIVIQIYYFIIKENRSAVDAFLLGLTTYGIYDFTSFALLNKYSLNAAVMDTIWGGLLYFLTIKIYKIMEQYA